MTDTLPDDFNTVRLRLKQLEGRDKIIAEKQDRMIEMLYEIKSALSNGERRMTEHSASIKALQDDSDKIRVERNNMIKELEAKIKADITEIAKEVHAKGSMATMITAITGFVAGVGTAIYQVLAAFSAGGKP